MLELNDIDSQLNNLKILPPEADREEILDLEDLEEAATGPIAIALNVNETPTEDPSA